MTSPFLKWPGGKRWAAEKIARIVSSVLTGTYYEPFLGGGAVFFSLCPPKAVLSDVNAELINTYLQVRDRPRLLLKRLQCMAVTKDGYYTVRAARPRTNLGRAARLLYLNRTAFGGIYRLNREGRFNVPYGGGERTPEPLWSRRLLMEASEVLAGATIKVSDFEVVLEAAQEGDVVYCDPTFTVTHDNNGFVRYNERNFSWTDQRRLATAARRAARRGAVLIVSNAHHAAVRKLYAHSQVHVLTRISRVCPDPVARHRVSEYLFVLRS
jgi:DNA adenine methylase